MKTTIIFVLVIFAVLLETANSKRKNERANNEGEGGDEEWPNPGSVGGFEPPAVFQEAPKSGSVDRNEITSGRASHNRTAHSGRSHKN